MIKFIETRIRSAGNKRVENGSESYSGKRVIRYEDGKNAEIFTLVLKGTNEESWYNTSSAGKSYIEINEAELNDILSYKEIESVEVIAKESDTLFRF